MKSTIFAVAAVLALTACGGAEEPDPITPKAGFLKDFDGEWFGTTTFTISGLQPIVTNGRLSVALQHDKAFISRLCPDERGEISATAKVADEHPIRWSGVLGCFAQPFADCPSVSPTITSATFTTYGPERLVMNASGTATGCGTTRAFEAHFDGGR